MVEPATNHEARGHKHAIGGADWLLIRRSVVSAPRLGAAGLRRLERQLSDREQAVVRSIAKWRLLSTRQLEVLHFLGSADGPSPLSAARTARRTLERLTRTRLVIRLDRRVGGVRAGSSSYVYALGPVGHRLLQEDRPRPRFREPSLTFLDHTLAVADVVVGLHQAERQGAAQLLQLEGEPGCWRAFGAVLGQQSLRPDLFVRLALVEDELAWFVEVDRGSEHVPAIIRKARSYQAYFQTGQEQAGLGYFPRVLWIVPDERRASRISRALGSAGLMLDLFAVVQAAHAISALTGGDG